MDDLDWSLAATPVARSVPTAIVYGLLESGPTAKPQFRPFTPVVLRADIEPPAPATSNELAKALGDAAIEYFGQSELMSAYAQDRFDLRITLEALGHPRHRLRDAISAYVLVVA